VALKNKSLKKSLKEVAQENTSVTQGTKSAQKVIKQGIPLDHTVKHLSDTPTVGVSLGLTKNMDNYESLRVDVWLTDKVAGSETVAEAYTRVRTVVEETLTEIVDEFI